MRSLIRLADRIVPPLLMAAGVTLIGAGLLSYGGSGIEARTAAERSPAASAAPADLPTATPSATGLPTSPRPSSGPPSSPSATTTPSPGSIPTASPMPSATPAAEVTRVVMPSLDIDLPVISRLERVPGQGPDRYPPCDVGLFHDAFVQPAEEGTTYLYAHAQVGMFLPLLEASRRRNGEALIGALVEVYTDDDRLYLYRVDRLKRHALDFSIAEAAPGQRQLVLQTSEGPFGTFEKVQVAGSLLSEVQADHAEAHPRPRPRACYPG
jgi:hypothetical protein